jgi:hypothetical protein
MIRRLDGCCAGCCDIARPNHDLNGGNSVLEFPLKNNYFGLGACLKIASVPWGVGDTEIMCNVRSACQRAQCVRPEPSRRAFMHQNTTKLDH